MVRFCGLPAEILQGDYSNGAELGVFGAERQVFPFGGAIVQDFGAERQVFPFGGAIFGYFGAEDLPRLRRGGRESANG